MSKPTYDELDHLYRAALKTIVQERQRADRAEALLLVEAARHRQAAQGIDLSIEDLRREKQERDVGRSIEAAAHANLPPIPITRLEAGPPPLTRKVKFNGR